MIDSMDEFRANSRFWAAGGVGGFGCWARISLRANYSPPALLVLGEERPIIRWPFVDPAKLCKMYSARFPGRRIPMKSCIRRMQAAYISNMAVPDKRF